MGLVDHDGAEVVRWELVQPLFPHQALNAAHRHPVPAVKAALLRLFHSAAQPGGLQQLVRRLLQQLAPVGQDQHPFPRPHPVLRQLAEHDGLAAAGGQHQQRPPVALFPLPFNGGDALGLIGAQGDGGGFRDGDSEVRGGFRCVRCRVRCVHGGGGKVPPAPKV